MDRNKRIFNASSAFQNRQAVRKGCLALLFGLGLVTAAGNVGAQYGPLNEYYECRMSNYSYALGKYTDAPGDRFYGQTLEEACTPAAMNACPGGRSRLCSFGNNGGPCWADSFSFNGIHYNATTGEIAGVWCQFRNRQDPSRIHNNRTSRAAVRRQCADGRLYDPVNRQCIDCEPGTAPLYPDGGTCEEIPVCKHCGAVCLSLGNPCDPATGNKYQTEVDYGDSGTGLHITRTYNSALTRGLRGDWDSPFGIGWRSNLTRYLHIRGNTIIVRAGDGRGEQWSYDDAGEQWRGDSDSDYRLVAQAGNYLLTSGNGNTDRYDASGKILESSTPQGWTTTYLYDDIGRLETVRGMFGRELRVTWDAGGQRIIAIENPYGGRKGRVQYEYTGNNLTAVVYPDGATRRYQYNDPAFPNHLTDLFDENGDLYAHFEYDDRGRALSTEHARIDGNVIPQERFGISYPE